MQVLILHDDVPADAPLDELDNLVQAEAISAALVQLGHQTRRLPFTLDLKLVEQAIRQAKPDLVFNLVETAGGTGRLTYLAPALLDGLGIAYTGAGTDAMFSTSSKVLSKKILEGHGIPTPAWFTPETLLERSEPLSGSFIIKSVWEDASIGIDDGSIMTPASPAALRQEMVGRLGRLGGEAFAESYIDGREFNLSLLGRGGEVDVLPPAEIHFVDFAPGKPRIVNYQAKWDERSHEFHHTPRCFEFPASDRGLLGELAGLARQCWVVFGLTGYARVDFRVDRVGNPWVLELNSNPCLSPDAGFIAAADRAGLGFVGAIQRIVEEGVGRH
ncbi:MAG: D-alanine--D-alanine ligase [Phycisphaerae bacterium]|nr:D-alanine--D-alanine ligase [Phycisphaerae bacterium]